MARFATANDIINRAALETGLLPADNPVGSSDESYVQLTGLLNSAGQELIELHAWQGFRKKYEITTAAGDTGIYDLPDDFSYMVDQTGWNKTSLLPVGGPISAQAWSYLDGLNYLDQPLYAVFQLLDNKFHIYPQPPPPDITVAFQYQSRNWTEAQNTGVTNDIVVNGSDLVMYEPILITKLLQVKFLTAKGFDSSGARQEFTLMMDSRKGKDEGAQILNAGPTNGSYLLGPKNTPWSNFGL